MIRTHPLREGDSGTYKVYTLIGLASVHDSSCQPIGTGAETDYQAKVSLIQAGISSR